MEHGVNPKPGYVSIKCWLVPPPSQAVSHHLRIHLITSLVKRLASFNVRFKLEITLFIFTYLLSVKAKVLENFLFFPNDFLPLTAKVSKIKHKHKYYNPTVGAVFVWLTTFKFLLRKFLIFGFFPLAGFLSQYFWHPLI